MKLFQARRLKQVFRAAASINWWNTQFIEKRVNMSAPLSFLLRELKKITPKKKGDLVSIPAKDLCFTIDGYSPIWRTTTGTDGMPITWAQDIRTHFIEYAAYYLRSLELFSFPVQENLSKKFFLMFNYPGVPDYYLSFFARALYVPYAQGEALLSQRERFAVYETIRSSRPSVLYGAPSALWWLATLVENDKIGLKPNLIVFSGEMMPKDVFQHLKRVFSCPIRSFYGTRELGTIGFSCPEGENVFHLNSEHIYLEVLDDNGKECPLGTYGNLTMTSLTNLTMPLIRYQPGDTGRWINRSCVCKTRLPRFEFQGRDSDFLLLPEEKKIPVWPLYDALFANGRISRIYQYQIEQVAPDAVTVRIVKKDTWTNFDSCGLKQAMEEKVDNLLRVEVQFVDSIEKRGRKHRPFVPLT